jgi:outer membrane lipoprotein-sorting protein
MKKILLLLLLVFWSTTLTQAASEKELDQVLGQINALNHFSSVYTAYVKISSYEPRKNPKISEYAIYVKGLDNILLCQKAPKKDLGKKILLKRDKIWFYFPSARRAIIINPTNTLFGTVAVGDVVSPPVLELYQLDQSESVVKDGQNALMLSFSAKTPRSPYGKLVYYYSDSRIIAAESYTRSGILLKKASYEEFVTNSGGGAYASKIKVENGVNPQYYAILTVSDLTEVPSLPDSYFLVEGLDKVNG